MRCSSCKQAASCRKLAVAPKAMMSFMAFCPADIQIFRLVWKANTRNRFDEPAVQK